MVIVSSARLGLLLVSLSETEVFCTLGRVNLGKARLDLLIVKNKDVLEV